MPRFLGREDGVPEGVARLGEEDLETGHAVDGRPMFGVVTVKDTNRSVRVHDRKYGDLSRQQATQAMDELNVRGSLVHLATMGRTARGHCSQNRRGIAIDP